jgi:hypothetical protein
MVTWGKPILKNRFFPKPLSQKLLDLSAFAPPIFGNGGIMITGMIKQIPFERRIEQSELIRD